MTSVDISRSVDELCDIVRPLPFTFPSPMAAVLSGGLAGASLTARLVVGRV